MKGLQCIWTIMLILISGYAHAQIDPIRDSLSHHQATLDSIKLYNLNNIYPDSNNALNVDSILNKKTLDIREKIEAVQTLNLKNRGFESFETSKLGFFDSNMQGFSDFKSEEILKIKQVKESIQGSLTEKKIPDNKLDLVREIDSLNFPNDMEKWRQNGDDDLLIQPDSALHFLTNDMEDKATAEFESFSTSDFDFENNSASIDNFINKESIVSEAKDNKRLLEKMKKTDYFKNYDSLLAKKEKLVEIKNKYKDVSDSRDLKGVLKKSSLRHLSFHHRLEYGLMVVNPGIKPFRPNLNLLVGYRINTNFSAGAGTQIGSQKGKRNDFTLNSISIYALHKVKNNIFIIGGYEKRLNSTKNLQDRYSSSREIFGGIGTDSTLKWNIRLRSQVTYSLNQAMGMSKKEYKPALGIGIGIFYWK